MTRAPDRYIVARCRIPGEWEWSNPGAERATRAQYDAGLIEMAQGRMPDGALALYAIPRRFRADGRVAYFGRAQG